MGGGIGGGAIGHSLGGGGIGSLGGGVKRYLRIGDSLRRLFQRRGEGGIGGIGIDRRLGGFEELVGGGKNAFRPAKSAAASSAAAWLAAASWAAASEAVTAVVGQGPGVGGIRRRGVGSSLGGGRLLSGRLGHGTRAFRGGGKDSGIGGIGGIGGVNGGLGGRLRGRGIGGSLSGGGIGRRGSGIERSLRIGEVLGGHIEGRGEIGVIGIGRSGRLGRRESLGGLRQVSLRFGQILRRLVGGVLAVGDLLGRRLGSRRRGIRRRIGVGRRLDRRFDGGNRIRIGVHCRGGHLQREVGTRIQGRRQRNTASLNADQVRRR